MINKVKIGEYIYTVEYGKNTGSGYIGYIDYEKGKIKIKNTLHYRKTIETLLHEIIHGIVDYYMLRKVIKDDYEEYFVDVMAKAIHALLKDNPELVEDIIREDNLLGK